MSDMISEDYSPEDARVGKSVRLEIVPLRSG
jgi:hypothetical protein